MVSLFSLFILSFFPRCWRWRQGQIGTSILPAGGKFGLMAWLGLEDYSRMCCYGHFCMVWYMYTRRALSLVPVATILCVLFHSHFLFCIVIVRALYKSTIFEIDQCSLVVWTYSVITTVLFPNVQKVWQRAIVCFNKVVAAWMKTLVYKVSLHFQPLHYIVCSLLVTETSECDQLLFWESVGWLLSHFCLFWEPLQLG